MEKSYRSLSGRRHDLAELTEQEQQFLQDVFTLYRRRPPWEEFQRQWINLGRNQLWPKKVAVGSVPYRICQDLAARLGIAEGKVSPPDYRDHLADLIEDRFGSRYAFCKQVGIDQGHLSRVLSGKKHLASDTLFAALEALGVHVDLVEPEELFRRAPAPFAPESRPEALSRLERFLTALRDLQAMAENCSAEEHPKLLERTGSFAGDFEQLRSRLNEGRGFQAVLNDALAGALTERARIARELAAAAEQEREAHEKVAG